MKILLVHNKYGKFSGEEAVVRDVKALLLKNGHEVIEFLRGSDEIDEMKLGKIRALLSSLYNPFSRRRFKKILSKTLPDIVHIHNLYPFVSPSILPIAKARNIPVVMTVHNFRLDCPNGLYYSKGAICERCHGGKEYWGLLRNCEGNIAKSFGYALRNWFARVTRAYLDNVTIYACLTEFQKTKIQLAGFPEERLVIIPNMVRQSVEPYVEQEQHEGGNDRYIGFVGRISREKGIPELLESARECLDLPFCAAGGYDSMPGLKDMVPTNFRLLGHCDSAELETAYRNSQFIVLPSVWYEGFPTVLMEAMLREKAIICSRIGGLPEIVDDGVNGLLFEAGNSKDLTAKIRYLWERPELCKKMGKAGRRKVLEEYSEQKYYERLITVYSKAREICRI